jgi:transcriptional regulator with XRE-family HTH domain
MATSQQPEFDTLADFLLKRMAECGFEKQVDLAKASGLSPQLLSQLLRGIIKNPGEETIDALARALRDSPETIRRAIGPRVDAWTIENSANGELIDEFRHRLSDGRMHRADLLALSEPAEILGLFVDEEIRRRTAAAARDCDTRPPAALAHAFGDPASRALPAGSARGPGADIPPFTKVELLAELRRGLVEGLVLPVEVLAQLDLGENVSPDQLLRLADDETILNETRRRMAARYVERDAPPRVLSTNDPLDDATSDSPQIGSQSTHHHEK